MPGGAASLPLPLRGVPGEQQQPWKEQLGPRSPQRSLEMIQRLHALLAAVAWQEASAARQEEAAAGMRTKRDPERGRRSSAHFSTADRALSACNT